MAPWTVALEITPPRQPSPHVLLRRARLLGEGIEAVNVIQRPDRQPSLDACLALRAAGLRPVLHLVTRGRSRAEVIAELHAAAAGGIDCILCVRGDHTAQDRDDTPSLRETVALARRLAPAVTVGVTFNQQAADRRAALRNLVAKLEAGAAFVQTQPVFEPAELQPLIEQVRTTAPQTRIVPMVMPLLSFKMAAALGARLGMRLPAPLVRRLEQGGEEAGWKTFSETLAALIQPGWADGVAVMTFEPDPPAATGHRIRAALFETGWMLRGGNNCTAKGLQWLGDIPYSYRQLTT
jgi:5,10-methylenetetrahydrofolate reductase